MNLDLISNIDRQQVPYIARRGFLKLGLLAAAATFTPLGAVVQLIPGRQSSKIWPFSTPTPMNSWLSAITDTADMISRLLQK